MNKSGKGLYDSIVVLKFAVNMNHIAAKPSYNKLRQAGIYSSYKYYINIKTA